MPERGPLAIFGASGRTGQALVGLALARGRAIRAVVRDSSRFDARPGMEVFRVSLDAAADVSRAVSGTSAVCCVFGPRSTTDPPFCARATERIVAAMWTAGVRRLVCQTGAMVGELPGNVGFAMRMMAGAFRRSAPRLAADSAEQEQLVMTSGLDWTLVKPPRLTDEPPGGRVRAGVALPVGLMSRIARADLAAFLLEEIAVPRHLRERVYVRR